MMNLRDCKLVTLFLLGVGSFLFGLAALPLDRRLRGRRDSKLSTLLLCSAAGALLATSLLHILPTTRLVLAAQGERLGISFLSEIVICAGFLLIYFMEELMDVLLGVKLKTSLDLESNLSVLKPGRESGDQGDKKECCDESSECHSDMERSGEDEGDGNNSSSYNPKYEVKLSQSTNTMFPNYHSPDSIIVIQSTELKRKNSVRSPNRELSNQRKIESDQTEKKRRAASAFRDILVVLAISCHSLFEGLAVGLEQNSEDVWTIFSAIALHKFIITFCACLELQERGLRTFRFLSYLTVICLFSPLGTGVGIIITETEAVLDRLPLAVLQGLAGGALLYTLLFRVLARERLRTVPGVVQVLGVILGFLVIMIVEIIGHQRQQHQQEMLGEEGEEVFYQPLPPSLTNTTVDSVLGSIQQDI